MIPPSASAELAALEQAGLLRRIRTVEPSGPHRARVDGREVVLFCTNDYLGLAADPRVARAAADEIARSGWGAGSSRLVGGGRPAHERLELALADFKGAQAALTFPTGYQANLAALGAVAGGEDCVFLDKLNHASLIDGARLCGARVRVYPHGDVGKLAELLADSGAFRRRVIAVDAVFSMDGDVAPLPEIVELAERHSAITVVDEAHGTGVLGETGAGAAELLGVADRITLTVGTLSKALGGLGGYVVGRREWIDLIVNRGRTFLFTTAAPPAQAAAALCALDIMRSEPERRARLHANARRVRAALSDLSPPPADTPAGSPIIPVVFGSAQRATAASEFLFERGLFVPAIRPPTVPAGGSRLRISVSAAHEPADLDRLIAAVGEAFSALAS